MKNSRDTVRQMLKRTVLTQRQFGRMLKPRHSESLIEKLERGVARLQPDTSQAINLLILKLEARKNGRR